MSTFQRTVNLKKENESNANQLNKRPTNSTPPSKPSRKPEKQERKQEKTAPPKKEVKKDSIDKIYGGKESLQEIKKKETTNTSPFYKQLAFLFFVVIACYLVFSFLINKEPQAEQELVDRSEIWYSIKLINDDVYYGKIKDESADPIVLDNVYYNYDQLKEGDKEVSEVGNLRLVKRGKETHGPSGTMEIYKEKILFKEPLAKDSPVLQAILNNEK